jgi:hypothetical protein
MLTTITVGDTSCPPTKTTTPIKITMISAIKPNRFKSMFASRSTTR